MNKYKPFFKIFFWSLLFSLLITFISNWKIDRNSLLGFIGYFFFSIYFLRKFANEMAAHTVLMSLLVTQCLIHSNVIYGYFVNSLYSLPLISLHIFGIISGYSYVQIKNRFKLLPFLVGSIFAVFMFYSGWYYWIHKLNYETFTGNVKAYNLPAEFAAFDERKILITDLDFSNKIVLLDFWNTRCGICFQKFPQVEAVYEKYKNDSSVLILAVNKPIEEDKPNQAFQVIKEEGYSFPVVITKDEDLAERFGVRFYPTTFVIDRAGKIVYKGGIEGAVRTLDNLKETD